MEGRDGLSHVSLGLVGAPQFLLWDSTHFHISEASFKEFIVTCSQTHPSSQSQSHDVRESGRERNKARTIENKRIRGRTINNKFNAMGKEFGS